MLIRLIMIMACIIHIKLFSRSNEVDSDPNLTLGDVIKQHVLKHVSISELACERQRIMVRRKHTWSDTKRAMKRPSFDS